MNKILTLFSWLFVITINVNAQWQTAGSPYPGVSDFAFNGNNIFAATGGGVYLSANNGSTWTAMNSGLPGSPAVNSIEIVGSNIFAATQSGGMYLSTDNAASWTAINNGLGAAYPMASVISKGTDIYATVQGGGLFKSTNNGANWTMISSLNVKNMLVEGNIIYLVTSVGLSKSTDDGATWTNIWTGPSNASLYTVAVNGSNIFLGDNGNAGVYRSTDSGATWTLVNNGLTATTIYAMIADAGKVYVGTYGGGIFVTSDNGATWTTDNTGLGQFDVVIKSFAKNSTDMWVGAYSTVYRKPLASTSITEAGNKVSFIIYPNPSNGLFKIESSENIMAVTIYNIIGKLVHHEVNLTAKATLDLTHLSNGVYPVIIETAKGSTTHRILIEK